MTWGVEDANGFGIEDLLQESKKSSSSALGAGAAAALTSSTKIPFARLIIEIITPTPRLCALCVKFLEDLDSVRVNPVSLSIVTGLDWTEHIPVIIIIKGRDDMNHLSYPSDPS